MRTLFLTVILASLTSISWPIVSSVSAQDAKGETKDTAGVRAAAREYLSALRRGDFKAAAETWTADGEYMDTAGHTHKARKLLAQESASSAEADAEHEVKLPDSSLRFVTSDVAIEDGKTASDVTDD